MPVSKKIWRGLRGPPLQDLVQFGTGFCGITPTLVGHGQDEPILGLCFLGPKAVGIRLFESRDGLVGWSSYLLHQNIDHDSRGIAG